MPVAENVYQIQIMNNLGHIRVVRNKRLVEVSHQNDRFPVSFPGL
jgi:hypothetical protein